MRNTLVTMIFSMFVALVCPINALAAPDQYCGDTAIYGAAPVVLQPNVLIILDNSGSMDDSVPGGAYDSATTYTVTNHCTVSGVANRPCVSDVVYTASATYPRFLNAGLTVLNVTTACPTAATNPRNLLQTTGQYSGRRLNTNGTCRTSGTGSYLLGNYINWLFGPGAPRPKIDIAQDVLMNLINSTSNVKFGLMQYRSDNQGSRLISRSVGGANYITTIKDMDAIHTGTTTNRQALVDVVDNVATGPWTPMGESLFETMRYFGGDASAFGNTIGITSGSYISPILFGCEKNYVIFISDGMATADGSTVLNLPFTTYGRYDGGFCVGYGTPAYTTCNDACDYGDGSNTRCHALPGVAKYMYEHNLITGATITSAATRQNNVTTYTIGFGFSGADQQAIELLRLTADSNHGHGEYFDAGNETALSASLTSIITSILAENSSFVAPVVPVSPENRTYTGKRIYMGFFKPDNTKMWSGNLKKFGLDCAVSDPACVHGKSNVLDSTGNYATYLNSAITATTPTPYHDSRDNAVFSSGAVNGSFRPGALSYWSSTPDGGDVEAGGAGEVLKDRLFSITSATSSISGDKRNIYTYMGTNTDLTHSSNDFSTTNALITATTLSLPGPVIMSGTVSDTAKLINFIHGFDTYATAPADTAKRDWILGDILHAKPLAISYSPYTFNAVNEGNCAMNKTMVYASSNDGMLHAFRDCDGSEAWAVIPRELLPDLQYLTGAVHTYFVDSTIQAYVYDHNKNGVIGDEIQDKAVLVIGLRRGAGLTTAPTRGFYYAIDVIDPLTPKYMWKISNAIPAFSDLGETWSDPKIGKIKINSQEKIVMFLGGGYDNCNEDTRYGATQTFSGSCVNAVATADGGLDGSSLPITSTGATAVSAFPSTGVTAYKGRAVYVVELATLNSNVPDFTLSGTNVIWSWRKSIGTNIPAFEYSLSSEMTALDMNDDGYVDRLYIGDVGGNMWRINIADQSNVNNWTVTKIFDSTPGADGSVGRKIFYNPSAFVDLDGNVRLYFGTGDREHPLNRAVTDRLYGLIDKGQTTAVTEAQLLDFTVNLIQAGTGAQVMAAEVALNTADNPTDTTLYGWYIRLDAGDRTPAEVYPGEKVLAPATVANGVVYFTTYQPIISASLDPCNPGNLGTARLYAVDYRTAEAVYNWDASNDSQWSTYNTNTHAIRGSSDTVYLRTDRTLHLGSGIPSGIVYTPPALLIGSGGGISSVGALPGGPVQPLFWKQRY